MVHIYHSMRLKDLYRTEPTHREGVTDRAGCAAPTRRHEPDHIQIIQIISAMKDLGHGIRIDYMHGVRAMFEVLSRTYRKKVV